MKWIKNLFFDNEDLAKKGAQSKITPPVDPQARYLLDALAFVKQQNKDLGLNQNQPGTTKAGIPEVQNLRDTLNFAKQQSKDLCHKQSEHELWQIRYGSIHIDQLKNLSGIEFEDYLAKLFNTHGYQVEKTPKTRDYGADLILHKDQQRVAVQAKCYTGSVGVAAVQEALSGMAYYRCQSAWVVTTGNYTNNAVELAQQANVRLIDRKELGKLILQMQG